jgi:hypothetical protein
MARAAWFEVATADRGTAGAIGATRWLRKIFGKIFGQDLFGQDLGAGDLARSDRRMSGGRQTSSQAGC